MSKSNLTKRKIDDLEVPSKIYALHRDSAVRGAGLKVEPTGTKTFFWARKGGGKLHWRTIGEYPSVSLEDARAQAGKWNTQLAEWKRGGFVGVPPWHVPAALTIGEVISAYKQRHILTHAKKPAFAVKSIDWMIDRYCAGLCYRSLAQVTRSEIRKLHEQLHAKHGVYPANRTLQLLKAAINKAIEWELWTGANPAAGIRMLPEVKRKRYLRAHELAALKAALDSPKTSADVRDYVCLAMFTGARKSNILEMRWADIDFNRNSWYIADPKNREPYEPILAVETVRILKERLARADWVAAKTRVPRSEWVFPSYGGSGHLIGLHNSWAKLLKKAGIENMRQHDMRHTMASFQSAGGASMLIVAASLGQKSQASAERYSHLDDAAVRASVEAAVRAMTTEMRKRPRAALPPAPKGKRAATKA